MVRWYYYPKNDYQNIYLTIMEYSQVAKEIRKKIVNMVYESQATHLGSALSCVDILTVLYFGIAHLDPKNPADEARDRCILSKGHAASALYATLAARGFFPEKVLEDYCKDGSALVGHVTRKSVPGVEVSTGSLGHGLAMGAGMALAAKRDNACHRVFVLLSDGECDEGSVWETALFAGHHQLDNLVGIVDYNKIQSFGSTKEVLDLEPFCAKWQAFKWSVKEIDGHNYSEIEEALSRVPFKEGKPSVIIAHTVKGKGLPFLENTLLSHYKKLTKEELIISLKALEE